MDCQVRPGRQENEVRGGRGDLLGLRAHQENPGRPEAEADLGTMDQPDRRDSLGTRECEVQLGQRGWTGTLGFRGQPVWSGCVDFQENWDHAVVVVSRARLGRPARTVRTEQQGRVGSRGSLASKAGWGTQAAWGCKGGKGTPVTPASLDPGTTPARRV